MRAAISPNLARLSRAGACIAVLLASACAAPAPAPTAASLPAASPAGRPATDTPLPPPTPALAASPPAWVSDFAQPILDNIRSRPPDFEDAFEVYNRDWIVHPWCARTRMQVADGRLMLKGCGATYSRINYVDYVLEVDAGFAPGTPPDATLGIMFREHPGEGDCSFKVWPYAETEASCGARRSGENVLKTISPGSVTWDASRMAHILLIVKGPRFAFYENDVPLAMLEHALYQRGGWWIGQSGGEDTTLIFDNFKIWDITALEVTP